MTIADRIRVKNVRVLSDSHYILKTTTFEWRRANGEWQTQHRETYDRGNGAALLPYNLAQRTWCWCGSFATRLSSVAATIS
jgi:ribonuclease HI